MAPGTDQARQQGHQPHRIAAAVHALHPVVQPDARRRKAGPVACTTVVPRQLAQVVHRHTTLARGRLQGPRPGLLAQDIKPLQVVSNVLMVQLPALDQLPRKSQSQRAIGSGPNGQVSVTFFGRLGSAGIDAPELGSIALGLLREGPEMKVGGDGVAPPDQDQPALCEMLGAHADLRAIGGAQAGCARAGTDGPVEQRCADPMEEARGHALALHKPHGSGIGIRQHRPRVAGCDRLQARCDLPQRLVPAHRLPAALTLAAGPPQGLQDALGVLDALHVARNLGAQGPVCGWVVRISLQPEHLLALDRDPDRTGVGAVMGAGRPDQPNRRGAGFRGSIGVVAHRAMMAQPAPQDASPADQSNP